jgi:hypothetical protein
MRSWGKVAANVSFVIEFTVCFSFFSQVTRTWLLVFVFLMRLSTPHLLHSATWWRLLGQKYLSTAEVTGMKLFGTDPVQRRVIRFVIQMKSSSVSVKADGNRKRALKQPL